MTRKQTLFAFLILMLVPALLYADQAKQVGEHFGIYIINGARSNPGDRAVIQKQRSGADYAVMYYWRNLDKRNPADVICDAYQWLLKGRNRYGNGAEKGFNKFSDIDAFELRLFDLDFSVKRGKRKGEFYPDHTSKEYLLVRVSRDDLKKQNFNQLWIDTQLKEDRCQNLKQLFSRVWFDQEFMRKKST
ncbi:MAG: hypothetical protein R3A45_02060 [Bdellovibrionota bacterium]